MRHKVSLSTSNIGLVLDRTVYSRLETDCRVRSTGALVPWNLEPYQGCLHISEFEHVPES